MFFGPLRIYWGNKILKNWILQHTILIQIRYLGYCTLKGQKLVTLNLPKLDDGAAASEHCSALKLFQMAGATQISEPPVVPAVSLLSVVLLDQTADQQHRSLHFSAYSSRAPPALS